MEDGQKQLGAGENSQDTSTQPQGQGGTPTPPPTQIDSNEKQWRNDQRRYWDRQINAQWWLNGITIAGSFIALGALFVLYGTLRVTQNTAETAAKQLELSERPWISVTDVKIDAPLSITNDRHVATIVKLTLTNIGKTPARVEPSLALSSEQINVAVKPLCSQDIAVAAESVVGPLGLVLFPNEPYTARWGAEGELSAIQPNAYFFPDAVVGCVKYRPFVSAERYYTGFANHLIVRVDTEPAVIIRFNPDGSIAANKKRIAPSADGRFLLEPDQVRLFPVLEGVPVK